MDAPWPIRCVKGTPTGVAVLYTCPVDGSELVSHSPGSGLQCPACGQAWSQGCVDVMEGVTPGVSGVDVGVPPIGLEERNSHEFTLRGVCCCRGFVISDGIGEVQLDRASALLLAARIQYESARFA